MAPCLLFCGRLDILESVIRNYIEPTSMLLHWSQITNKLLNLIACVSSHLYLAFAAMASNDSLRNAFRQLQEELVRSVDPDSVMDFLFSRRFLSAADCNDLNKIEPRSKAMRGILTTLHNREHPDAFVILREKLATDSAYAHLVEKIDSLSENNLTSASSSRGEFLWQKNIMAFEFCWTVIIFLPTIAKVFHESMQIM